METALTRLQASAENGDVGAVLDALHGLGFHITREDRHAECIRDDLSSSDGVTSELRPAATLARPAVRVAPTGASRLTKHRMQWTINRAFASAAGGGFQDILDILLACGANVNADTNIGKSALQHALAAGRWEICDFLLQSGARINPPLHEGADDIPPLAFCARRGLEDACRYLLARGARVNVGSRNSPPALHQAVSTGYTRVAQLLLAHGATHVADEARVWGDAILFAAHGPATEGESVHGESGDVCVDTVRDLVLFGNVEPRFRLPSAGTVWLLLRHGASVNSRSSLHPLHAAATRGAPLACAFLISEGADLYTRDSDGRTWWEGVVYRAGLSWNKVPEAVPPAVRGRQVVAYTGLIALYRRFPALWLRHTLRRPMVAGLASQK